MRVFRWLLGLAVLGLVVFVVLGVTPIGRGPFQRLFPVGEVEKVNFASIGTVRGQAQWLVCPGFDMCKESDDRTPTYDNDVNSVKRMWDRLLREQFPNMELVQSDDAAHQYTYVVRRSFFQLPDLVTIQIFPVGETRSNVAIYSRSVYKLGDFGANTGRVIAMMNYLDKNLSIYKR